MYKILVVDDEEVLRKQLVSILKARNYEVHEATNGRQACEMLVREEYPLVLCDIQMPEMTGMEFLKFVRDREFSTTVALVTAHGNIQDAITAIRHGAFEYVEKPINEDKVIALVEKAERAHHILHTITYSAPQLKSGDDSQWVGESHGMKRIFQLVERLAKVNTSVLIRGENGTGKELVARAIHYNSPRRDNPFVAVNCAAMQDTLIESELFGHEKGAFTGADQRKIGKFQYAAGGTLFLDEIGDTSLAFQVKLLRALQDHTFLPVGANREVKADVRIIAATNRDLEKAIQAGAFREDLFYRLNVMPIFLPALKERTEDIPALVHHFIEKFNHDHGNRMLGITNDALSMLEAYRWPGNIRELENAIEHAFILEASSQITVFSLPEYIRNGARKSVFIPKAERTDTASVATFFSDLDWEKGKETFEREFIVQALRTTGGRINMTAEQANIPKNTLLRKIKKYNINPREYGGGAKDLA